MANKAEWNRNTKTTLFFTQRYSFYVDIPHSNSAKILTATMANSSSFSFSHRHLYESFYVRNFDQTYFPITPTKK